QQSLVTAGIDPATMPLAPAAPADPDATASRRGVAVDLGAAMGLDGTQDELGRERKCPTGSFPKVIFPLETVYRFRTLEDFFRKSPGTTSGGPLSSLTTADSHQYAHAARYGFA